MIDPQRQNEQPSDSRSGDVGSGQSLRTEEAAVSSAGGALRAKPLTPEEQMALFEKDLKENDWGHQPC